MRVPAHRILATLLVLAVASACSRPAPTTSAAPGGSEESLPLKRSPQPTVSVITAADVMTRLYIIADDSMMGRQAGARGNLAATQYVAEEFKRFGLEPAGDSSGFFQWIPLIATKVDIATPLTIGSEMLTFGKDYSLSIPFEPAELKGFEGSATVFGGSLADTAQMLSASGAQGKVVVIDTRGVTGRFTSRYQPVASAIVHIVDSLGPDAGRSLRARNVRLRGPTDNRPQLPITINVTPRVANILLGGKAAVTQIGATGVALRGAIAMSDTSLPARNVVGILRGNDPALSQTYIAISAHNDHVGFNTRPVDHDSLRAVNTEYRRITLRGVDPNIPPAQQRAVLDSLKKLIRVDVQALRRVRGPRQDSIFNGANDDGSGTVALLEIAEAMALAPQRPRRSIIFVSHTAEEAGLLGSKHFTDHPTVPRDSIIANLNMDMIGRGRAEDTPGGGPRYLELIGSRRLSAELGNIIEWVNLQRAVPLQLNYAYDVPNHPAQRYCRSDHFMYARYGIPITYFSAGHEQDYHQVTDEPQYIDYPHLAQSAGFVRDVATVLGNLNHRPAVRGPRPDPTARCVQ
jgi:hypothetical protein